MARKNGSNAPDGRGRSERWTSEVARRHMEAHQLSSLPLATYTRKEGVTPSRLQWWKTKLEVEAESPKQGFARVRAVAPEVPSHCEDLERPAQSLPGNASQK